MSRKLVTLRPDMTVLQAAAILIKNKISGAPVVSEEGALLGVFSEFDCLRSVTSAQYEGDWHDRVQLVGVVMTGAMVTVSPETDAYALAHLLTTKLIRRLPVLENGKLVGQVSRRDVFEAMIRLFEHHGGPQYPDYPEGRRPIGDYPRD
jgi:CBS domain-containing protein